MKSEGSNSPNRSKRFAGAIALMVTTVTGSVLTGWWQGIGTNLSQIVFDRAVTNDSRSGRLPLSSVEEPKSISGLSKGADKTNSANNGFSDQRFEKMSVPLIVSVTGEGESEESSRSSALELLNVDAQKKCEKISLEQKGFSYEIRSFNPRTRTCASVGGHWRCIADAKPDCVVMGNHT